VDLKKNNLAALQELRDVFSRHKENLPLPGEAYNPFSQEASCFLFFQDRAMILFFLDLKNELFEGRDELFEQLRVSRPSS